MEEKDRYKPEIIKFDVDWLFIKDACMQTISKRAGEKEPSTEWKKKLLLAEHSPLRRSMISIRWDEIPSYVSTHFARHHEGVEKFVATSRADRTGIKRSERKQTDFVSMQMDMNIQALINICRKRLCSQADIETRKYCEGLVEAVAEYDPIIAWACVQECIRDCGCSEKFGSCRYFENFAKDISKDDLIDMEVRYNKYNEYRAKRLKKEL